MVERDEINEEITSGDAESMVGGFARCEREGRDLCRRASNEDCEALCAVDGGTFSMRSMASNNCKDVQSPINPRSTPEKVKKKGPRIKDQIAYGRA